MHLVIATLIRPYTKTLLCYNIIMNRGEITGQFLRIDKSEIGLPMRSTSMTKKEERKNVSVFDNMTKQNDKAYDDNERTFDYFDPYTTSYATDATIQPLHTRIDKHQIRSMIKPMNESMNDSVQNISSYNSEYLNKFTLNVFYNARQTFQQSFCILPIGIMSLLAGNDLNIKKIIRQLNNSEMFYQNKVLGNNLISRTSVITKITITLLWNFRWIHKTLLLDLLLIKIITTFN
jgi:hypothetical protein